MRSYFALMTMLSIEIIDCIFLNGNQSELVNSFSNILLESNIEANGKAFQNMDIVFKNSSFLNHSLLNKEEIQNHMIFEVKRYNFSKLMFSNFDGFSRASSSKSSSNSTSNSSGLIFGLCIGIPCGVGIIALILIFSLRRCCCPPAPITPFGMYPQMPYGFQGNM